jgi:HAD superfamily hydrolase (TIGR01509 family)
LVLTHRPDNRKTITMKAFRTQAVIFDFDGTLTRPGALDFKSFKKGLGCPFDQPVLEFIQSITDHSRRAMALDDLQRFEMAGAAASTPNPGAEAIVGRLKAMTLKLAILSRNSRRSIDRALANFSAIGPADFDLIVSRDDQVALKPSGDGVHWAAAKMGVKTCETMVVGDFIFDIEAGRRAGAVTVLLCPAGSEPVVVADFTIASLAELEPVVRLGLALRPGKLPNDILGRFLADMAFSDPSVLVRPGIGQDTAALDLHRAEVLILSSDPITFATDQIGHYAAIVNANDIATSGAIPRWLLTTLLLPCGTTAAEVWDIMHQLKKACDHWGVTLCGGHTEVTDAVSRPVITGTMAATMARSDLIDKHRLRPGDQVIMTKAAAVEATAIIAREMRPQLLARGMSSAEVDACTRFLEQISIITEARIAAGFKAVSALHDVTEGGVATALEEFSQAAGFGLQIEINAIPVFEATRRIGALLNLNPLGLIGSGSLLIGCRPEAAPLLMAELKAAGVAASRIGEVIAAPVGVRATANGHPAAWPRFDVDEIARLFARKHT